MKVLKMLNKLSLIFLFSLIFFKVPFCFAQSNDFVSIVNPVRGLDFWAQKDQKIEDSVIGEADILKRFNLNGTWLLRFDAMDNQNILSVVNQRMGDEKGLFLEVTPTWSNQAGVTYHKSESWHLAGSAFLTGYEIGEREKLIDTAFGKFKNVFGFFPKSVGAWWIDSYSIEYMQKKYGITGAMIVSDQYSTDNYQIWGQYFSTPYYPSKINALHPAQSLENKLPVVITQWAARDPVNSYGNGVSESTYSVQANDYKDFHNLDTNYFSKLLDIYGKQPFNSFSHVIVGLENSYLWEKYKDEYENQIAALVQKKDSGQISIISLKNFANFYMFHFPNLSPPQIIVADDPSGSFKKAVWFMNPYFRAGWFLNADGSVFRDIRQYVMGEQELCYKIRCDSVNFATSATRVLDDVSFGHKWIIDEGKITNFKVDKLGENFIISYSNEAGTKREIEFLPRDISIDGKVSSVDTAILNAVNKDLNKLSNNGQIKYGSFKWSLPGVLSKIITFVLFLAFSCFIPGLLLTKKNNLFLSLTVGLVFLTLIFYIAMLVKFKLLVPIYILTSVALFIRLGIFKQIKFNFPNFKDKGTFLSLSLILAGTIFQSMPTFKSGLEYSYGLGLWGPNTHDGIWHIALINQLIKTVPPQNPIFAGTILKNYHFFYDLLIAATNFLSGIPTLDLVFRFYPVLFSLMLGVGTYYLIRSLFNEVNRVNNVTPIFSLYLVYFAGSFGWIVEYLTQKHLGGESAFWANQSISFNLNPPFAISLIIIIAIFQTLTNLKSQKGSIFILTLLTGTLIAFKAYGAILILATLFIVSVIRKSVPLFTVFVLSAIFSIFLFLSNFSVGEKLILFSPFWFIHSMIDSPDRVGWVRLSLARTTAMQNGNWVKFFTAETLSFLIFIFGNLGTRFIALFSLSKLKMIWQKQEYLLLFIFSSLALLIPIFFIQAGNPWNTIQFIYYFLYVSAVTGGVVMIQIMTKFNKIIALSFIFIILFITPINSWASANGYLSFKPHAKISSKEIDALKFLASQKDGIVLTFPYDDKLKQRLSEPWPLLAYDSTAYVSAISNKSVYLEDEPQNQILLTDYKKRLVAEKDFFSTSNINGNDFLKTNKIKYIYLPKIFRISLNSDSLSVKPIFENDEVIIYEIKN